ncbi:crossover junction endodeoxyribonuclease RuvC [Bacteriovoracales bacterium]|nr:crossover junction endodeoxyribonuclease RuvC [Bacteriovoracales bacterium]
MLILGVDPGSRKAGFSLIQLQGKKAIYVDSFTVHYDVKLSFLDRLGRIYNSCSQIINDFSPNEIAIESLVYVKNVSSLAKLAQARGAMIGAFMQTHEGKVFEYSPNFVKASVTSYGHASKEAVQRILDSIFGEKDYDSDDESDALAIAFCHSISRSSRRQKSRNVLEKPLYNKGSSLKSFAKAYRGKV